MDINQIQRCQNNRAELIDRVKVLHVPTPHDVGHFGDVLPSQSLGAVLKKLNLTRQKQTTQEQNSWLGGPAVEHWSLADVLSLSCARLVADG